VSLVVLGEKRHAAARQRYECDVGQVTSNKPTKKTRDAGSSHGTSHTSHAFDLDKTRTDLAEKLKRPASDDDLYSHLMYPGVFADFAKHATTFSDVSVLPTTAFFYGLKPGEEISVNIEEGKVLIIRLISVGTPDKDGRRTISYELNGTGRESFVIDKTITPTTKAPKADLADVAQVAAPIPGLIAQLIVSVGSKVTKGDKLLMMEAMKMQNTVYAPCDGVVAELHVALGDTVESKDLLIKIRPPG